MNPAQRLVCLVREAWKRPENTRTEEVWKQVLGTRKESDFFYQYSRLLATVDEARSQLEQVNDLDRELHLQWVGPMERLLDPMRLHREWRETKTALPDPARVALDFAAHELSRRDQPGDVADDQMASLQKEVEELQAAIIASSMDERIKVVLLQQTNNVRLCLQAYRVSGADAIREAIERCLGSVVINFDAFKAAEKEPLVARFMTMVTRLDKVASVALRAKELVAPAMVLLRSHDG